LIENLQLNENEYGTAIKAEKPFTSALANEVECTKVGTETARNT